MIKEFEKLTPSERELLYRAPVLISVLVSSSPNAINEKKKNDAIKLAHLRTFTAPPILHTYYHEVDRIFKDEFEKAVKEYYPFDEEKRAALEREIARISAVTDKLDKSYAQVLNNSLDSYARHVKKSEYSVFRNVIFPFAFSRLNDL